jgi:3-deoxy-D-manno-octulosonic-acid transferase
LVKFINENKFNLKFIIAPHNIKTEQIEELRKAITKNTILYSQIRTDRDLPLQEYDVFILDTIGILSKIYSYADIAYVGGGFGNPGVHNILEPATFGVPIVIGPNYSRFAEVIALVNLGGCIAVTNQKKLNETFDSLIQNGEERYEKGHICATFVQTNRGATGIILKNI